MNNYQNQDMQNAPYGLNTTSIKFPIIFQDEQFVQISKYISEVSDYYYISNYGRIFSSARNIIISPMITHCGYLSAGLVQQDNTAKRKNYLVHRLVMICFKPIENYDQLQVNHINGRKYDNYLSNLEWVTQSENMQHCYRNGLEKSGEDHEWATMTNDQAEMICKLLEKRLPYKEIAKIVFNDETRTRPITYIKNNMTWKNQSLKYNIPKTGTNKQRFTDDELYKMYEFIKSGLKPREVAIKMGIDIESMNEDDRERVYRVIRDLRDGKAYKHIER